MRDKAASRLDNGGSPRVRGCVPTGAVQKIRGKLAGAVPTETSSKARRAASSGANEDLSGSKAKSLAATR